MNLLNVTPGDVIQYDPANIMDADVPLLVLACCRDPGSGFESDLKVHILALYMVVNGTSHLQQIVIDNMHAEDYRCIVSARRGTM